MFKIDQTDSYKWPVTIQVPEDGGRFSRQTFTGVFKRLPQSRIADIAKGGEDISDISIAREILIGWDDVSDGSGPVEFTSATLDRLLDVPGVAAAIVMAFMESLSGARRKN